MEPEVQCEHCVQSAVYLLETYTPYLDAIGIDDDKLDAWDVFLLAGKIMQHGSLTELRNFNEEERTALREKLTRRGTSGITGS